jgi:hypothetical protein
MKHFNPYFLFDLRPEEAPPEVKGRSVIESAPVKKQSILYDIIQGIYE